MKTRLFALCFLAAIFAQQQAGAQTTNHQAYALFVYSIAKYSSWPSVTSDFKIVVVGNSRAYEEMQKAIAGKSISGGHVKVEKSGDPAAMADAQIIYVSESKSGDLQELVAATAGRPVMIITEREGLHKKGAGVSFIIIDNKLRFDINHADLEKRQVKMSAQITRLANEILN